MDSIQVILHFSTLGNVQVYWKEQEVIHRHGCQHYINYPLHSGMTIAHLTQPLPVNLSDFLLVFTGGDGVVCTVPGCRRCPG